MLCLTTPIFIFIKYSSRYGSAIETTVKNKSKKSVCDFSQHELHLWYDHLHHVKKSIFIFLYFTNILYTFHCIFQYTIPYISNRLQNNLRFLDICASIGLNKSVYEDIVATSANPNWETFALSQDFT